MSTDPQSPSPYDSPREPRIVPARRGRSFAPRVLTERQLECLAWAQEGKSASDIGAILGLSRRTVEGHFLKVCAYFGVKTRVQAILRARDAGYLNPPAP